VVRLLPLGHTTVGDESRNMASSQRARRWLAILLWFVDGLLWGILLLSSMGKWTFLRGGIWLMVLLTASLLPILAVALRKTTNDRRQNGDRRL
jgi:hypothetical protein